MPLPVHYTADTDPSVINVTKLCPVQLESGPLKVSNKLTLVTTKTVSVKMTSII